MSELASTQLLAVETATTSSVTGGQFVAGFRDTRSARAQTNPARSPPVGCGAYGSVTLKNLKPPIFMPGSINQGAHRHVH